MRLALAGIATGALLMGMGNAAVAADGGSAVDPKIAAVMTEVPGGVVVDYHHAVWPALDMAMAVPILNGVTAYSVGSCATGKVCAYDQTALTGASLTWGTCSSFTISAFTVRSIADARTSGYVQARYGTTVRATAAAGAWANVSGSVDNVRCADPNVG